MEQDTKLLWEKEAKGLAKRARTNMLEKLSLYIILLGSLLPVLYPQLLRTSLGGNLELLIVEYGAATLLAGYALLYMPRATRIFAAIVFRGGGLLGVGFSLTGVTLYHSPLAALAGVAGSALLMLSSIILDEEKRHGFLDYAATDSLDDVILYATMVITGALAGLAGLAVLACLIEATSVIPVFELLARYSRRAALDTHEKVVASGWVYATLSLAALAILA